MKTTSRRDGIAAIVEGEEGGGFSASWCGVGWEAAEHSGLLCHLRNRVYLASVGGPCAALLPKARRRQRFQLCSCNFIW